MKKGFNPDWCQVEAALDSIREHMAIAKAADERAEAAEAKVEELKGIWPANLKLLQRVRELENLTAMQDELTTRQSVHISRLAAKCDELLLTLSTAHIKGMEEALEIVQYNSCPCCLRIAARIKELTP